MGELTKEAYKISELAEMLSVSVYTVRRRLKRYRLKVLSDAPNLVRVPKSEAQKLIDRMSVKK